LVGFVVWSAGQWFADYGHAAHKRFPRIVGRGLRASVLLVVLVVSLAVGVVEAFLAVALVAVVRAGA